MGEWENGRILEWLPACGRRQPFKHSIIHFHSRYLSHRYKILRATQYFTESDLVFTFPDDWVVRAFDSTVAYQSVSGHGLKGVDFIVLSPDGQLWLIEVKNYRPRISTRNGREYRANRKTPEALSANVTRKFHDSQRLIRVVDTWLRRSWWRRLRLWWQQRKTSPGAKDNYWFWAEAKQRLAHPNHLQLVLWLETPERKTDFEDSVAQLLKSQLMGTGQITVAKWRQADNLPFGITEEL